MNYLSLTWIAIGLLAPASGPNYTHPECLIEFTVNNAGVEVSGSIGNVNADINFDDDDLGRSTIVAKAEVKDIRTGIAIRDKHLQTADYFHADLYPDITVASRSFRKVGRNKFVGAFLLTIKNFRKEIKIPFSMVDNGSTKVLSGAFTIDRLDFDIGEKSMILDETVRIVISARIDDGHL